VLGVFRTESKGFIGIREKFGEEYLFEEYHRDTGPPLGTVRPYEKLEKIPDEIENCDSGKNITLFEYLQKLEKSFQK
jgi:hypothetical protein